MVNQPESVSVHPLVLLSVVDHYFRVARNTQKRVVGVLLGQVVGNRVNVANSYALPFEEDEKDSSVWFLDHNFHESMYAMFKKVNAKEKMVGWYHSGPKLRGSDIEINEMFKKYISNPVLVVVDVKQKEIGIPTDAYCVIEHLESKIEAEEAEEIGVEHLLRDVSEKAVGTLMKRIEVQLEGVKGLGGELNEIVRYLDKVLMGKVAVNQEIMRLLQNILNQLPVVETKALNVVGNDELLVIYLSSLVRSVIALDKLIDNSIQNMKQENFTD